MELCVDKVGKRFGDLWAVRDVDLRLGPGVLGLLGPNGAGKSTLMRVLATVTRPTTGQVRWNGAPVAADPEPLRSVLGYLPQDFGVYPHLDAVEFLEYMASAKGIGRTASDRRIDELLAVVNLGEARHRPLGEYSGGMRQRLGIAQALLNDPELLIVDEPTVGLDPEERARFRSLLVDLSGDRIVILSTHIVSDVESTASAIALLDRGRLLAHVAPEGLIDDVEGKVWDWTVSSADLPRVRDEYPVSGTRRHGDGVRVRVVAPEAPDGAVPAAPSLEEGYLWAITRSRVGRREPGPEAGSAGDSRNRSSP